MADNGDHALRICSRFQRPIDAMITDVEMPGMSGFTLAAEVSARRPLMPVLFMSGSVTEDDWKGDRTMPALVPSWGSRSQRPYYIRN